MRLIILGSGNVASALGSAFFNASHTITQVYDRNLQLAKKLALNFKANPIDQLQNLSIDADAMLFCLSDDIIPEISAQIIDHGLLYLHTSGSVSLQELNSCFTNCAVMYPLQTISHHRAIDFTNVPICIEASNSFSEEKVKALAKSISQNIHFVNTEQRLALHLAAVMVNNFSNSLYISANKILEEHNLSTRLLNPLILETAMKAIELGPDKSQTGPALRNDQLTIKKHLQLLDSNTELKLLYQLLTEQIQQQHKSNNSNL